MNRQIRIALLSLVCGIALWLAYVAFRSEPRAQGQSLSTWLAVALAKTSPFEDRFPDLTAEGATNAIREIGSNAVPILVQKLQSTEPKWKESLLEWLTEKEIIDYNSSWYNNERGEALIGFQILGPEARSAIPKLTELLLQTNTTLIASIALGSLGSNGVPVLREALSHQDPEIRMAAISAPYFRKEIAPMMLSDMFRMTNDPDPRITRTALTQIGMFAPLSISLPILTNYLYDPRLRDPALAGLRRMGTNAHSATPHLLNLYHQEKPDIKRFILPVLQRTDPAIAAQLSGTNVSGKRTRE